jgi:hypothetical protein
MIQDKQPIVFDSSLSPTPDYYNIRYAADNIKLPIVDYVVTIWAVVVRRLQLCIIGCLVLEAGQVRYMYRSPCPPGVRGSFTSIRMLNVEEKTVSRGSAARRLYRRT